MCRWSDQARGEWEVRQRSESVDTEEGLHLSGVGGRRDPLPQCANHGTAAWGGYLGQTPTAFASSGDASVASSSRNGSSSRWMRNRRSEPERYFATVMTRGNSGDGDS